MVKKLRGKGWKAIRPETPLSELSAKDLVDLVGWLAYSIWAQQAPMRDINVAAAGWKFDPVWGRFDSGEPWGFADPRYVVRMRQKGLRK